MHGALAQDAAETAQAQPLIVLARATVAASVMGKVPPAAEATATAGQPAQGVFVTIEQNGAVVGCRGTLAPQMRTLEAEIRRAARAASTHDPRYRPLSPDDLKRGFLVTVTLIDRLEPMDIASIATLTPDQGLVLEANGKTGVVLPWEGKDPRTRLRWAYRKAGIAEGSGCALRRMIARRYRG